LYRIWIEFSFLRIYRVSMISGKRSYGLTSGYLLLGYIIVSIASLSTVFGAEFIGSRTSDKYHYPTCKQAKAIKAEKILRFSIPENARKAGYTPCPQCKPPKATLGASKPMAKTKKVRSRMAEELLSTGKALVLDKKCKDALPYFYDALKEDRNLTEARLLAGVCESEVGMLDEALTDFRQVIAVDPGNASAYYNLGATYARLGRYREAADAYLQSIRRRPEDALAHYNLGIAYVRLERHEDAVSAFTQTIRIKPELAMAHNNLGIALSSLKRPRDAAAAFREAAGLKPDDAFAHYNLGVISISLGEHREAIESLKKACMIDTDDEMTRYHLGFAYLKTGDRKAAADEYNTLRRLNSPLAVKLREEIEKQ
jgi:tetratricopeptide (TPR) repeat protein